MTQLTDKIYAVEVLDDLLSPEYSFEISIGRMLDLETEDDEFIIRYRERVCGSPIGKITVPVTPGTYRFLFTTKTATEEDARKVVRSSDWHFPDKHIRYVDYKYPYDRENKQRWGEGFGTALESLRSLLRSKGLDPNKNYALIEKQSSDE